MTNSSDGSRLGMSEATTDTHPLALNGVEEEDEDATFRYPDPAQHRNQSEAEHDDTAATEDGFQYQQTAASLENGYETDDASSGNYAAKLRSVMGSDDSYDNEPAAQEQTQQAQGHNPPSPIGLAPTNDGPTDTSQLPDMTFETIASANGPSPFRRRPKVSDFADVSYSSIGSSITGLAAHRRPVDYPTLLRLRSRGITRPSESWLSSDSQRLGSGPFNGLYRAAIGTRGSKTSISSSLHSRSTSLSGSLITGQHRQFPYGPSAASISDAADASIQGSLDGDEAMNGGAGTAFKSALSARAPPTERGLFKWSALRKAATFFKDGGKRPNRVSIGAGQTLPEWTGQKTVFAVGGNLVAIGTSRGYTFVFDFSQELRCVCGTEATAEAGAAVTSLAFSADHTFVAVGHAKGHVFLYDLSKPSAAARHIPPVTAREVTSGRKEGHLEGSKVLHIAFVGTRHTAVFTADNNGLAFYHSLGKIFGVASNDTLRLLGRYPEETQLEGEEHRQINGTTREKRSPPIVSMAVLPLGSAEHPSDSVHFVSLMTIHKLVIVGLRPSARTWYRKAAPLLPREPAIEIRDQPSFSDRQGSDPDPISSEANQSHPEIDHPDAINAVTSSRVNGEQQEMQLPRSATSAWFPSYFPEETSGTASQRSPANPRLAFAFDRQLFLLDVSARDIPSRSQDGRVQSKTTIDCSERLAWTEPEEPIESVQWISPQLLLLLTPGYLKLFDLRMHQVTEQEAREPSLRGLLRHPGWLSTSQSARQHVDANDTAEKPITFVAHSIRAHRGKAFFLTYSDIVVGHLLSWTDRLLNLVSSGQFLTAIDLAAQYYAGTVAGSLVGLPEDGDEARSLVKDKLMELMSASARYAFSPDRLTDQTHVTADGRGVDRTALFEGLAHACAKACLAIKDTTFLFDTLFDMYSDNGIEGIFAQQMETFILDGQMSQLPIAVTQRLLSTCERAEDFRLAESIIWHIDPLCLDLDQTLRLCLQQRLYDAFIYTYNSALQDYVSPIVELLQPMKRCIKRRRDEDTLGLDGDADDFSDAYKIFSYFSVILSGRSFPAQEEMSLHVAVKAKTSLYAFIFSGRYMVWPPGEGGSLVMTADTDADVKTFPYLRLFLEFDTEAFLDALDIAFEDSYLAEADTEESTKETRFPSVSYQSIIDTLLEVSPDLPDANDRDFASIFVARNAPKYAQFIKLSPSIADGILQSLAASSDEYTREDRQLAVESLLSIYRPTFDDDLLVLFEQANFWRILQSAYRASGKWGQLVAMFLADQDLGADIFSHLTEVLTTAVRSHTRAARSDLDGLIIEAVPQLIDYGVAKTAKLIDHFFPSKHSEVLDALEGSEDSQLQYLKAFADPTSLMSYSDPSSDGASLVDASLSKSHLDANCRERYFVLLAKLEPEQLLRNLDAQPDGFFDLEQVVESSSRLGVPAALLWALDKQDQPAKVFDSLDKIVAESALGMRWADDLQDSARIAARVLKVTEMAVRICSRRCLGQDLKGGDAETDFPAEEMWYRVLRSLVSLIHGTNTSSAGTEDSTIVDFGSSASPLARDIVQETLSAMVTSMSSETVSFPALFRRLVDAKASDSIDKAGSPSTVQRYADVRIVVDGMMTAYRLRSDLLNITNRLYDRETFGNLSQLNRLARRGWRSEPSAVAIDGRDGYGRDERRGHSPLPKAATPPLAQRPRSHPKSRNSSHPNGLSLSLEPALSHSPNHYHSPTTPLSALRMPARGIDLLTPSSSPSNSAHIFSRRRDSSSTAATPGSTGVDSPSRAAVPSPTPRRVDKGKGRARDPEPEAEGDSGRASPSDLFEQGPAPREPDDYFSNGQGFVPGEEDESFGAFQSAASVGKRDMGSAGEEGRNRDVRRGTAFEDDGGPTDGDARKEDTLGRVVRTPMRIKLGR